MRLMESGRGRKGLLDRITLRSTVMWSQVKDSKEDNRKGEVRHGSLKELLWAARHGK